MQARGRYKMKPEKIDQLVYLSAIALAAADKLYALTPEEIKIVEGNK